MKWGTHPVCDITASDGTNYDPLKKGYGNGNWQIGNTLMTDFINRPVPQKVRVYFPAENQYAGPEDGWTVAPDATWDVVMNGNCVRSMRLKLSEQISGTSGANYLVFSEHEGNNHHGGVCIHDADNFDPHYDCDGNREQDEGVGLFMRHASDELSCSSGSAGTGGMWKSHVNGPKSAKCFGNTLQIVDVQFKF